MAEIQGDSPFLGGVGGGGGVKPLYTCITSLNDLKDVKLCQLRATQYAILIILIYNLCIEFEFETLLPK